MKRNRKYLLFTILIVVGSFLYLYGFTFAKYVSNSAWDYYFHTQGFYFTSDYLGENAVQNVDNLWDGDSVYFNVKNNLNQAVVTDYDINYKVVCNIEGDASSYAECRVNGTSSNTEDRILLSAYACINTTNDGVNVSLLDESECTLGGYDWISQIVIEELYFDVVLTDISREISNVVVDVTVSSTHPYRKTLNGKFILQKSNVEEDVTMEYRNYLNYDRLIVSNSYSDSKCLKLTWDSNNLILDADDSDFSTYGTDSNGYINEIKFNIGSKRSLSYIFYSRNFGANYTVAEFSIQQTGGC